MLILAIFCGLFWCKHIAATTHDSFPLQIYIIHAWPQWRPRALEARRTFPAGRKTKECRRASERVSARDVPGIKTRRRHCWEEERRSKGLSGKAAVAAGGKADGWAENLDADGAREQASGVETRDFYFIFMLKCRKRKISWDGFKRKISRCYFHL